MFSSELRTLLFQVIRSWQVIAVTAAVILYLFLVFYVAKTRRRKRPAKFSSTGKSKKGASKTKAAPAEITEGDDLGLEQQE